MVNQTDELEFESKTQRKHYAHSMVDLAHKLAEMKHSLLIELPINEQIINAIVESKKITSHIARKRHFQYLGKLLLKDNHEEIVDAIESKEKEKEAGLLRQPLINLWLEKTLEDMEIINELYPTHDNADIQTLRQLARSASKESANSKKNRRKLFEHLRMMDLQHALPMI